MRKALIGALAAVTAMLGSGPVSALTVTPVGGDSFAVDFDALTFTITGSPNQASRNFGVVFQDFFVSNSTDIGSHVSGTLNLTQNGNLVNSITFGGIINGTISGNIGQLDANDLVVFGIGPSGFFLSADDVITIEPLDFVFESTDVPEINAGPFSAVFADPSAQIVSAPQSVALQAIPLPASLTMLLAGLAAFGIARRVKCRCST